MGILNYLEDEHAYNYEGDTPCLEEESQVIKAEIESDHLKYLPSKTIQDNQILKKAVDKYRSTEHGDKFESFELF